MKKLLLLLSVLWAFSAPAQPIFPPATQPEVDAGVLKSKFVSPFTLSHYGGSFTGVLASATNAIAFVNGFGTNTALRGLSLSNLTVGYPLLLDANFNVTNGPTIAIYQISNNFLTVWAASGIISNLNANQFTVNNMLGSIKAGALVTNLSAQSFTNQGFTLLQGNTIMGTNGYVVFGDPVNFFAFTNWDPLFQMSGVTIPVPGTVVTMYGGSINLRSNTVLNLGNTGVDDNTNKLLFNRASYIWADVAAGDTDEINRYRLNNTSVGFHSNDIVRMWELTNSIRANYTNLTTVDTNSMMFSNGVLYAQRQSAPRNVFYDDFNYPTLYGSQITGRNAYGNQKYYNSGYMSNYNTGGLLKLTDGMPGTRNFYLAVSNSFINNGSNWTRFGMTFVPYHGSAADGGTNNFATIGMLAADYGDVALWGTITNTLHTYFDLINWQLVVEHGCVGCLGGVGTEAILQTNLLQNGTSDIQWGQPYFLEYTINSNRLTINFNGKIINIYDPRGTNYFGKRVVTWELTGDGTNYNGAAFDSVWAGYSEDNIRLFRPSDASTSSSDYSLMAPEQTVKNYTSDTVALIKKLAPGGGVTIADQVTNLLITASAGSPSWYSNSTLIAAQPSFSIWAGPNLQLFATNNTTDSRLDYFLNPVSGAGGGAFNVNQFSTTTTTNIKSGALVTNLQAYGLADLLPTASRVLMLDANNNLTNVTSSAASVDYVHADGTVGTPTGVKTNSNQFGAVGDGTLTIKSGALQTNVTFYTNGSSPAVTVEYRNGDEKLIPVQVNVAGNDGSGIRITDTASTMESTYSVRNITTTNTSFTIYQVAASGVRGSNGLQIGSSQVIPLSDNEAVLGSITRHWKTNWATTVDASNIVQRSFYTDVPSNLKTNATAVFGAATNLIADGLISSTFTNYNISFTGLTNIYVTNMQDHQELKLYVFVATGNTVAFPQFTATNYLSGAVETVDTNCVSEIRIMRSGVWTNLTVKSLEYSLSNSTGITFTTNYVNKTIAISSTASGGGGPFNTTQFDASSSVTNIKDGAVVTNLQVYGATSRNYGSNLVNWVWLTNQLYYSPQEFNGSNGTSGIALTNNWDMSLNAFKPVTNFVGTNLTFTISNVVKSSSLISAFIGNGGYSNNVAILATSGINIKWLNWATNGTYDFQVRPNYSYVLQLFADRATNVNAWISTDDPYIPVVAWSGSFSNLTATNIWAQAGGSTSNVMAGAGVAFKQTAATAFTNLNATVTTFTNAIVFNSPAHFITNLNDSYTMLWRGVCNSGTNNFRVVYGSHIWDPGMFTNLLCTWEVGQEVTRTAGPGGFTNQHVDAWINISQNGFFPTTNVFISMRTNYEAWQTNGIATSNMLQVASRAAGGVSNNWAKVLYEPSYK